MHVYVDTHSLLDIYQFASEEQQRLKAFIELVKIGHVSLWLSDNSQIKFNNLRNAHPEINQNGWQTNYLLSNALIADLFLNSERVFNNDVENFVITSALTNKKVCIVSIDDSELTKNWSLENTGKVAFYPDLKFILNSTPLFNP